MCWNRSLAIVVAVAFVPGGLLLAQTKTGQSKSGQRVLPAQTQKVQRPEPQKTRPQAQALRIEKTSAVEREDVVDPALDKVLSDWEARSAGVQVLYCSFKKYRYNHKWQIEYRSEGKVMYKAPDHGVYIQAPTKITADMKGRTKDVNSKPLAEPYQLQPDKEERWVCNGSTVTQINQAEKTYRQDTIPEEMRGKNIVEGPLPFLFGMKADRAKERYWMKLIKHDRQAHEIWLDVYPKTRMDAANYQRATVVIEDENFTPKAVRLFDPTGMEEIVHTFMDMRVNPRFDWAKISDPFNPSLIGYKPIITGSQTAEIPEGSVRKTGATLPRTPVRQK